MGKKKNLGLLIVLTLSIHTFAQVPCVDGFAGSYPCKNVDLQSFISVNEMGGSGPNGVNDIWGWTDPNTGSEYALVGKDIGMAIVDISNPVVPVYLGTLPTHEDPALPTTWRDIKVIGNYAYIGSENPGHGLQIFDLTQLASVENPPVTFSETAHYDGYGNSHNTVACEGSNIIYGVGTSTFDGGPHFVDVQNPLVPIARGGFGDQFYCHDAQVVIYTGPDQDYVGKEIYFGCHGSNAEAFIIADFTDKSDPQLIKAVEYENHVYSHQGWLTPDMRFFLLNDEIDESTFGYNTRTRIFNVQDLDNPIYMGYFESELPVVDHNLYTRGNFAFLSNYTGGLRIYDITDIENMNIFEEAYFDVHPWDDGVSYAGSWSNYPYFDSGNIIVTHRSDGLYIVRPTTIDLVTTVEEIQKDIQFDIFPNPTSDIVSVISVEEMITFYQIVDERGRTVMSESISPSLQLTLDISELSSGIYILNINGINQGKTLVKK